MMMLKQYDIQVITGCPELEIETIAQLYLDKNLITGENSCGHDSNHSCHNHQEGHSCKH